MSDSPADQAARIGDASGEKKPAGAKRRMSSDEFFTRISTAASRGMGQPQVVIAAVALMVLWAVSGPFLHWSDTWQLLVNTVTSVVTFIAVFLIQNGANRDGAATQAKLDEILRALDKARVEFIGIEHLTDAQICAIRNALEGEVAAGDDKAQTADDSVDQLLKRLR